MEALYKNDFIELFNRGTTAVNVSGWSVQYASATGSSWQVTRLSGIIAPGSYYLIQQAFGTGGVVNLPTPDATGTISMSTAAGKVALVSNQTTALTDSSPTSANIIDFVGYGSSANFFEKSPTAAPSNTNSVVRTKGNPDTDNNSADFVVLAPNPRNSTVNVIPVNTAPTLDNIGTPTLTAIDEDILITSNTGTLVSAIIASGAGGNPITDPDTGAVEGIAVTAVDNTNGSWQYSIDSGSNWSNFSVSSTSAVLLRDTASDRIRFVPNANYNGTANITFRAWDAFDGKASGTTGVNPGAGGGTTAFSTAAETANITVNPVNDRPTFSIGGNQSVKAGTGQQTITGWAYGFNPGADNESGQKVAQYIVEVINNSGVVQGTPTINQAGDLIYTPGGTIGTAEFRVKVRDDGGTANGGFDTSISTTQTFKIIVNPTATNSINGTPNADTNLMGTDQSDRISALDGDDTVFGGLGSDRIFGGIGNDILYGDLGIKPDNSDIIPAYGLTFSMDDTIAGGAGGDKIYGNLGNDKLYGDEGNDSIWGGAGDDTIWGGDGNDTLWGDAGKDTFVLVRGQGLDIIQDFESQDLFGCAGSLRYSFLDFQKQGSDTLIFDQVTKQHLATLIGFTGSLNANNNGGMF